VAAHPKRARRRGAYLALIDESGFLLSPLVRRTLAPRGHTPILPQSGCHREKISAWGVLTVSPRRQRLGLYAFTLPNGSFDHQAIAQCLRRLLRQVRGRLIVVWDRGPIHRGPAIRQLLAAYPRLEIEELPGYAPELNPVEQLWNHLKWSRLCNYAPTTCHNLHDRLCDELILIRDDPHRLRSFFDASDLPFPTRALAS
jgi:transposase